jgi:hypothetical protein
MFQIAMVAEYVWYISAKLQKNPMLLNDRIYTEMQHIPILTYAVRKKFWDVQIALLEHGADPN